MAEVAPFPDITVKSGTNEILIPSSLASTSQVIRDYVNDFPGETTITLPTHLSARVTDSIQSVINGQIEKSWNFSILPQDILETFSFFDFYGMECSMIFIGGPIGKLIEAGDFSNFELLFDIMKRITLIKTECKWVLNDHRLRNLILNSIFYFSDYKGIDASRANRCDMLECLTRNYFLDHTSDEEKGYFSRMIRCEDLAQCTWTDELLMKKLETGISKDEILGYLPYLPNGFDWTNVCAGPIDGEFVTLAVYGNLSLDEQLSVVERIMTQLHMFVKETNTTSTRFTMKTYIGGVISIIIGNYKTMYSTTFIYDKDRLYLRQPIFDGVSTYSTYSFVRGIDDDIHGRKEEDYLTTILGTKGISGYAISNDYILDDHWSNYKPVEIMNSLRSFTVGENPELALGVSLNSKELLQGPLDLVNPYDLSINKVILNYNKRVLDIETGIIVKMGDTYHPGIADPRRIEKETFYPDISVTFQLRDGSKVTKTVNARDMVSSNFTRIPLHLDHEASRFVTKVKFSNLYNYWRIGDIVDFFPRKSTTPINNFLMKATIESEYLYVNRSVYFYPPTLSRAELLSKLQA